jgi:hypothetical protein
MKLENKKPVREFTIPGGIVRTFSILLLGIVIFWLGHSIIKNDLALPTKYHGMAHFHGRAVWFLSGSVFCFTLSMLGLFNAPRHHNFNRWMRYVSYSLFAVGFIVAILGIQNKHLPQPSDIWTCLFCLLCGVSLYVLVALMASTIPGGWGSFAKTFPAKNRPDGVTYSALGCWWWDRSFSRYLYNRGRGIRIIFADAGIYFDHIFISRVGAPPFLLPWDSVKRIHKGHDALRGHFLVLEVENSTGKFKLELPERIEQELSRFQKDSLIGQ